MIIHMVLFKFEEPVSVDFEETVEYHCEQIRQHCEGVILFDLKKNFSDRAGGFVYAISSIFKDVESLDKYQPHPVHEELKKYLSNFPGQRVVYDGELAANSLVESL
ncbi:MAG: Dabb family protein [Alcaligenaceae bacterium]|nr:Dabb family protein [Alcaligenaceae bacterium]HZJ97421.1 Dabb family protein [Oligella sp.]